MARKPSGPWLRKGRGYFVKIHGKQVPLGTDKTAAERQFHKLMAEEAANPLRKSLAVSDILERFLDWVQKNRAPRTYDSYRERLGSFDDFARVKKWDRLPAMDVRPFHVREWTESHKDWAPGMIRGRIMAVQTAFNWAAEEGFIPHNPIRKIRKPPQGKRETVIEEAVYQTMLAMANPEFRDLISVCWSVGCRPQEITKVERRHLDTAGQRWVFPIKESKGKKRTRIVYMTDDAMKICERLAKNHPTGKLFRNTDGLPWTPSSTSCTFKRWKKTFGIKFALVDFRHTFVTRAIKRGVDPITLANLLSHADTSMLARVYSHIAQDTDHLKKALYKASGV